MSDESLVEMARRAPADRAALAAVRGVNEQVVRRSAEPLLDAVKRGLALPDEQLPKIPKRKRVHGEVDELSDLMSALMVLFLVVMAVTLVAVTQSIDAATRGEIERTDAINKVMSMIAGDPLSKGVGIDQQNHRIDLGKEVRFESGSYTINATAGEFLRTYVPVLLRAQASVEGQHWMRSIVIEGFTDQVKATIDHLDFEAYRAHAVAP